MSTILDNNKVYYRWPMCHLYHDIYPPPIVYDPLGNGDCLFACLKHSTGDPLSINEIRDELMAHLFRTRNEFLLGSPETMEDFAVDNMKKLIRGYQQSGIACVFPENNLFEHYRMLIARPYAYGSRLEYLLYAHLRHVNIVVYGVPRENGGRVIDTIQGNSSSSKTDIVLLYTGAGVHYMALTPSSEIQQIARQQIDRQKIAMEQLAMKNDMLRNIETDSWKKMRIRDNKKKQKKDLMKKNELKNKVESEKVYDVVMSDVQCCKRRDELMSDAYCSSKNDEDMPLESNKDEGMLDTQSVDIGESVDMHDTHNHSDDDEEMLDADTDVFNDDHIPDSNTTSKLRSKVYDRCDNCMRAKKDSMDDVYHISLKTVLSNKIRPIKSRLKIVESHASNVRDECAVRYHLCKECATFLENTAEVQNMKQGEKEHLLDWVNTWPAFYWSMLTGHDKDGLLFHTVYDPSYLWRFVPASIRPYWFDESDSDFVLPQAYEGCLDSIPFFVDRTMDVRHFHESVREYDLTKLLRVMRVDKNGKTCMVPDVLCPFGESEFCFLAEHMNPALLIQHHLRKVVLNLPSGKDFADIYTVETSRDDFIRPNNDYDKLLLNKNWIIMPSLQLLEGRGLMVMTCRHHKSRYTRRRLHCHIPRKPFHNLSSEDSDQLSPVVIQPRTVMSQKQGAFNSGYRMTAQLATYSGVDSMNVTSTGRFKKGSVMLGMNETLSLAHRGDISMLLSRYVQENIVPPEFESNLHEKAKMLYPSPVVEQCMQGATYVPLLDSIRLQISGSVDNNIHVVARRRNRDTNQMEERLIFVKPSWSPLINIMQKEDRSGYGYPFQPVSSYTKQKAGSPTMMLWSVAGAIIGCKELWFAMTQRNGPYRYDGWDGHMLSHLQSRYMRHDNVASPRGSPFLQSKDKAAKNMLELLDTYTPEDMTEYTGSYTSNPHLFYKFGVNFWRRLFPPDEFPLISIRSSTDFSLFSEQSPSDVVIVVRNVKPTAEHDKICVGDETYELRVIMCMGVAPETTGTRQNGVSTNMFEAVRYVRHGRSFSRFWKDSRVGSPFMTHCLNDGNAYDNLRCDSYRGYFSYVSVYVRLVGLEEEKYRLKFFRTVGGQSHVYCKCNSFPLILTNYRMKLKRCCIICGRGVELFRCCNFKCRTRICKKCYDNLPINRTTTLDPPTETGESSNDRFVSDEDVSDDESEEDTPPTSVSLLEQLIQQRRGDGVNENYDDDRFELRGEEVFDDYLTSGNYNPLEEERGHCSDDEDMIPFCTDAGEVAREFTPRYKSEDTMTSTVPCHVILNQLGSCCTRYNKRIEGTIPQRHFLQKLTSTMRGCSWPLLYPMGALFPGHFYACATDDPAAVLGALPLSCYSTQHNPHGMASTLSTVRNLLTHSSSSTSTCPNMVAFGYDIQSNKIASGVDSRLINRLGFKVDLMEPLGMSVRDTKHTRLTEGVDSHQAALDLAAVQQHHRFDLFCTFTCNQATWPGVAHLYEHKESLEWTTFIDGYSQMTKAQQKEVSRSFQQAYGMVLLRCWMEARKLWLEYITFSVNSATGEVGHSFWRDEYQDDAANLPHIHGLLGLKKDVLESNETLKTLVYDLIKCDVCSLFPTEDIPEYIEEELFSSENDWHEFTKLADRVLTHKVHTPRCMMKVNDKDGQESLQCRIPHPVFDSITPLKNDLIPFKFDWEKVPACLDILEEAGMYTPPSEDNPDGVFHHKLFTPHRHRGIVDPGARCRMSPVIPKFFAATRSMQNAQVMTKTDGVARYVVKYVVELDKGNQHVIRADPHTGAGYHVDRQFLHNTKINRSRLNEERAFNNSRDRNHPTGRGIAVPEMMQPLLGYSEIMCSYTFERIQTTPLEMRSTTKITIDSKGNLVGDGNPANSPSDVSSLVPAVHLVRLEEITDTDRYLRANQLLLYRGTDVAVSRYDSISLFGLRATELLELFDMLKQYYRWFVVDAKGLTTTEMKEAITANVTTSHWIDVLGRRFRLRFRALEEVLVYLSAMDADSLRYAYSRKLRQHLMSVLPDVKERRITLSHFVAEEEDKLLPIVVFSSIKPSHPTEFLLHILLSLGRFETELDFQVAGSFRESLVAAKLIGNHTDEASLRKYSIDLIVKVIKDILPYQPATMTVIRDYIIEAWNLFFSLLVRNDIPASDIPPCLLTDMYMSKDTALHSFMQEKKNNHLESIYSTLSNHENIPARDAVKSCTKMHPLRWDPLNPFFRHPHQSQGSYEEQRFVVSLAKKLINRYCAQCGEGALTYVKNLIVFGVPGSGKSYIMQLITLYAMSKGLRVMTSAIMGTRATLLGGIHLHKLLGWSTKTSCNVHRLVELAIDKLRRKNQASFLQTLLTVDVLFIDESGQMAAEQLSVLNVMMMKLRRSSRPFGGVLVIQTMDPEQLDPVNGLPLLVSSLILTNFILVEMKHSVRAHDDVDFQRIQNITRMYPDRLRSDAALRKEFKHLVLNTLTFVDGFDAPEITPNTQLMFARRVKAFEAASNYVQSLVTRFHQDGTNFRLCDSEDFQHRIGSRADYVPANSEQLIKSMNKNLKEPPRLLFFEGAQFEATINGQGFFQSQLLLMTRLPSEEQVRNKSPIQMFVSPMGIYHLDTTDRIPTEDELIAMNWKMVTVSPSPRREVSISGMMGYRKQYSIRPVGASTINKQTGNTLSKCAIDFSRDCRPWEKAQIVVMLSRTRRGKDTIIVTTNRTEAVDAMYDLICIKSQWTDYTTQMLQTLTADASDVRIPRTIDYTQHYPYRPCNVPIPNDNTGFVYMLISMRDFNTAYVGQTDNLLRRFQQHNNGYGSQGTMDPLLRPYFIGAYICGLTHMDESERKRLEYQWQYFNNVAIRGGRGDVYNRVLQGQRVVDDFNYNRGETEKIHFIITVTSAAVGSSTPPPS